MKKASIFLFASMVSTVALFFFVQSSTAKTPASDEQVVLINDSPLYADPDRNVVSVGTDCSLAIADRSPASENSFQRLIITNTHNSNNACVCWVAAAGACASACDCDLSGSDDGDLILPRAAKSITVAGDLRTCVVAGASSTVIHISRAEIP